MSIITLPQFHASRCRREAPNDTIPLKGIAHVYGCVSIAVFKFDPVLSVISLFTRELTFGIVQTHFNPDLFSLT